MKIYSIGEDAKEHWPWIRPYIVRAIRRNVDGYTAADALRAVLSGDSFFLVCEADGEVLGVCKVDVQPEALHVHTLAGKDLKTWIKPLLESLDGISRGIGKSNIKSMSRPAIGKMLTQAGCRRHSWFMARTVT